MSIPTYTFVRKIVNDSTGANLSGALVELRRGATTITLTELGTSANYRGIGVTAGRYELWVNNANTLQSVEVGEGELAALGFQEDAFVQGTASGYRFLTPAEVPEEIGVNSFDPDNEGSEGQQLVRTSTGYEWMSNSGVQVETDSTLEGDGTIGDPLRIAKPYPYDIVKEPTGFCNPERVDVEYNPTTRKVTITSFFFSCKFLFQGETIQTFAADTPTLIDLAHDDIVGSWFLYHDGTSYVWSQTPWEFSEAQVCYVYYGAVTRFGLRECHGLMPWQSHERFHDTIGTTRASGGDVTFAALQSATPADKRPTISAAVIVDEDIKTTNAEQTGNYCQMYVLGAGATTTWAVDQTEIVPVDVGTGRAQYNQFTGGAWQLTNIVNNSTYAPYWLVAVPTTSDSGSQKYRYMWMVGQTAGTLQSARDAEFASLDLGFFFAVAPEFVPIEKIIVRGSSTANAWTIHEQYRLEGSRTQLIASPSGNFLTTVTKDATLTGDGTALLPLGVNLANANTWTAIQTIDSGAGAGTTFGSVAPAAAGINGAAGAIAASPVTANQDWHAWYLNIASSTRYAALSTWGEANQFVVRQKVVYDGNSSELLQTDAESRLVAGTSTRTAGIINGIAVDSSGSSDVGVFAGGSVIAGIRALTNGSDDTLFVGYNPTGATANRFAFNSSGVTASFLTGTGERVMVVSATGLISAVTKASLVSGYLKADGTVNITGVLKPGTNDNINLGVLSTNQFGTIAARSVSAIGANEAGAILLGNDTAGGAGVTLSAANSKYSLAGVAPTLEIKTGGYLHTDSATGALYISAGRNPSEGSRLHLNDNGSAVLYSANARAVATMGAAIAKVEFADGTNTANVVADATNAVLSWTNGTTPRSIVLDSSGITASTLAGTGTRLVTATAAGLLGNETTIAGNYTYSGNLIVNGNTTLGDAATDTLTVNAYINSPIHQTGTGGQYFQLRDTRNTTWNGGESLGSYDWYTSDASDVGAGVIGRILLYNDPANTGGTGQIRPNMGFYLRNRWTSSTLKEWMRAEMFGLNTTNRNHTRIHLGGENTDKVRLNAVATGTIAAGGHLGVDSNGDIVKATAAASGTQTLHFANSGAITANTLLSTPTDGTAWANNLGVYSNSGMSMVGVSVLADAFTTNSTPTLTVQLRYVDADGSVSGAISAGSGTLIKEQSFTLPNTGGVGRFYWGGVASFTAVDVPAGKMVFAVVTAYGGTSMTGLKLKANCSCS
jgi:hypothetical protein